MRSVATSRAMEQKWLEGLKWPKNAKIAISFVINYEEGGERSVLLGDGIPETNLRKYSAAPDANERSYSSESEFEYGSRGGSWRLFKLFNDYKMKFTVYAVAKACEEQPKVVTRCVEMGHDVASHPDRRVNASMTKLVASLMGLISWIDRSNLSVEAEKQHIRNGITNLKNLSGCAPHGWYYGRLSPQSRARIPQTYEEMGEELMWASDAYADDIPWRVNLFHERDSESPKGCHAARVACTRGGTGGREVAEAQRLEDWAGNAPMRCFTRCVYEQSPVLPVNAMCFILVFFTHT
ncbi:hypothetical protein LTR95_002654 [Oleoguttula sp. CCFEE 5521]